MTSTILSHRPTLLKTMTPLDAGGYAEGLRLTCLLTHVGPGSIELDRDELRAVLRELPTAMLLEVLGERGLTEEALQLLACTPANPLHAPLTAEEEGEVQAADLHLCGLCGSPEAQHVMRRGGILICTHGAGTTDETSYVPATPERLLPGNPFLAMDDPARQGE